MNQTKEQAAISFVIEFQRRNGLTADGWAGDKTFAALGVSASPFDAAAFFTTMRKEFGSISKPQVAGVETLLTVLNDWPVTWVAYGLATAWHETHPDMQPIKERGGEAYFRRMYDINGERPAKARELGNLLPGDGAKYAGRGYVQLTGRTNYERYGLGERPDDAMKPEIAARILKDGMEKGRFTGKALKDYLPGDYVGARRIINGTGRDEKIADYAVKFEKSLKAGGWK